MKYNTQTRQTGIVIDTFGTRAEAEQAIKDYETIDIHEGTYEEDYYEIVEAEGECISSTQVSLLHRVAERIRKVEEEQERWRLHHC